MKPDFELNYFTANSVAVSLDPQHSDNMSNAIVMKHVVGTLVRYSSGGQFLPYLVEKYASDDNGYRWVFFLRPDLKCEDGERITAQGYIDSLTHLLRVYSSQGPLPVLSTIKGWDEFMKGNDLQGLKALSTYEIEFSFAQAAGAGFLEYLSMPYFGYFCASNFRDGKWNDGKKIVSSGPYKVSAFASDAKSIELDLRRDWSLNPSTAPKKVFFSTDLNKESWGKKNSVLQANLSWNDREPQGHQKVSGPPDLIRSIVIDPEGPSGFFKDREVRKILRDKILELRDKIPFKSKSATLAKAFYAGSNPVIERSKIPQANPQKTLKVYLPNTQNEDTLYVESLLRSALDQLDWKYEVFTPGKNSSVVPKDAQSRTNFDLRVSSVIAGSVVEPWVVEMMFCSNMGVSYPDPSGRVCEYARKLMKKSEFSFSETGAEISRFVAEDTSVLPICHGRTTWFFSNDLDVSRLAGDLIIPSFEDIGLKD